MSTIFFLSNDISSDHCLALGLDNTNANVGDQNYIKARASVKNPDIVIVGCPCYILHNAYSKAASAFADTCGFDIEDHAVDCSTGFIN